MKTHMKRIICALFCMCILVSALSACGGSGSKDSSSTGNTASQGNNGGNSQGTVSVVSRYEKVENPYANMPEEIKGQTVRFATWADHYQTEGAVPLSKFEADTGLKAELFYVEQPGYVSKLMTKMQSGDVPDVFLANEDNAFPNTLQIAQPINKCSTVDLTDPIWDQSMIATATIDGNVYLVNTLNSPWSGSNLVYYNKTIFSENNIKTPEEWYAEGNWTWDTFEQTCKKIVDLGSEYTGANFNPAMLAESAGVSFVMYDYKTNKFSSGVNKKELVKAYETYADWRAQGLLGGTLQGIKEGTTGMYVVGVYGLKSTGHWREMDPADVGYTYLPSIDKNTPCRISSVYRMYGICKGAPHANAAGYFLRHFLDYENYDLENAFITPEAGTFYYQLINTVADQKYFNFDQECAALIGGSEATFMTEPGRAPKAQVNTKIQAVSNLVDQAVKAANKLLDDTRKANR